MSSRYRECKVYVGNLGSSASKHEIQMAFGKYGQLRNVWVARNPPGFAFVEFEDRHDAEDAVQALDGSRCCGTRIRVEMSSGRDDRKGRGGGGGGRNRYSTQDINGYFGRLPLELAVKIVNLLDDRHSLYLTGQTCPLLAKAAHLALRTGLEKSKIWSYFERYSAPHFRYERYRCDLCKRIKIILAREVGLTMLTIMVKIMF